MRGATNAETISTEEYEKLKAMVDSTVRRVCHLIQWCESLIWDALFCLKNLVAGISIQCHAKFQVKGTSLYRRANEPHDNSMSTTKTEKEVAARGFDASLKFWFFDDHSTQSSNRQQLPRHVS